jgi:uncharacterized protein (DUF924 family)
MEYQTIISFWFEEINSKYWFKKDADFDQQLKLRFFKVYLAATRSELYHWRQSPMGSLAEIIVLDQFSRNFFRESAKAFEFDSLALALSQNAIEKGFDQQIPVNQRSFLYMPFMHSESLIIHDEAIKLFSIKGLENNLKYEHQHRNIIMKFGRYPHRNQVLGRQSNQQEIEFLNNPGSSF